LFYISPFVPPAPIPVHAVSLGAKIKRPGSFNWRNRSPQKTQYSKPCAFFTPKKMP
jgi:hypothetical protein